MAEEIVKLGKITSAFGVKGWVKIFSYSEPRLNILNYSSWLLKQDGQWRTVKVLNGRQQGKTIAAQLEGVSDRNLAEALSGVTIGVYESQLPELQDDEFYWRDLEGMSVINQEGVQFGTVTHLIETGSNDVLVIKETSEQATGKNRKERMVPFIPDVIVHVNAKERQITVEWDADF